MGTACNLQAMVFGNLGESSATGVAFTRDPSTVERKRYGEWLPNAHLVSGIRTPLPLQEGPDALQTCMPKAFAELSSIAERRRRCPHCAWQPFGTRVCSRRRVPLRGSRSASSCGLVSRRPPSGTFKDRRCPHRACIPFGTRACSRRRVPLRGSRSALRFGPVSRRSPRLLQNPSRTCPRARAEAPIVRGPSFSNGPLGSTC